MTDKRPGVIPTSTTGPQAPAQKDTAQSTEEYEATKNLLQMRYIIQQARLVIHIKHMQLLLI